MRLYPPAYALGRRARPAIVSAGTGSRPVRSSCSPRGPRTAVRISGRPRRFDPDRFDAGAEAARPRYAYFPFAGGLRGCIGEHFAMTEAVTAIATLLARYTLRSECGPDRGEHRSHAAAGRPGPLPRHPPVRHRPDRARAAGTSTYHVVSHGAGTGARADRGRGRRPGRSTSAAGASGRCWPCCWPPGARRADGPPDRRPVAGRAATAGHRVAADLRVQPAAADRARPLPRAPARLLVSAPPGYALRLADEAVDAWRFEGLVRAARAVRRSDPGRARAILGEALELWQGPAYAEFADEPWAATEAARLEELRLLAAESLIEVTLRAGAPGEAVPLAEVLTREQPLREESWRLLALALWGGGRQADALAALRPRPATVRRRAGPGPRAGAGRAGRRHPGPAHGGAAGVAGALATRRTRPRRTSGRGRRGVRRPGRRTRRAGRRRRRGPRRRSRRGAGTGEAGRGQVEPAGPAVPRAARRTAGWSRSGAVPSTTGRRRRGRGWRRCAGSPNRFHPGTRRSAGPTAGRGPAGRRRRPTPSAGRFRLRRAVCAWLRRRRRLRARWRWCSTTCTPPTPRRWRCSPRVADEVGGRTGPARRRVPARRRRRRVAGDARRAGAPLTPSGCRWPAWNCPMWTTLVRALHDGPVDAATVEALAERTARQPLLPAGEHPPAGQRGRLVATSEVPEGVRDVLRRRLARLPPAAVSVLRVAAVVGLEARGRRRRAGGRRGRAGRPRRAGGGPDRRAAERAGARHGAVRARAGARHRLHRPAPTCDAPGYTPAWPRRCGELRPDDHPALAHHYSRAASAETAALAVEYAVGAAELAERRYAHDTPSPC